MKKITAPLLLLFLPLHVFAQPPTAPKPGPAWIYQQNRQVIGGDIVHWGTGVERSPESAQFLARQMATKALIEECGGIAHKEIIPWNNYVATSGDRFIAFAQVSLSMSHCAEAKKGKKDLENPSIVKDQKAYNKLIKEQLGIDEDEEDKDNSAAEEEASVSTPDPSDDDDDDAESPLLPEPKWNLTPPKEEKKAGPISSQKQACLDQYRRMNLRLNMAASASDGNMADPALSNQYNEVDRQRATCEAMK